MGVFITQDVFGFSLVTGFRRYPERFPVMRCLLVRAMWSDIHMTKNCNGKFRMIKIPKSASGIRPTVHPVTACLVCV